MTSLQKRRLSRKHTATVVAVATLFALGCSNGTPRLLAADGGGGTDDTRRLQAFAYGRASPPPREELLSIATRVESLASQEGATARAVSLYATVGRAFERLWRSEARPEDANRATAAYGLASRNLAVKPACESAVRGALFLGDVERSATSAYLAMYRVRKAAEAGALPECIAAADAQLQRLDPFRPSDDALEAVVRELAESGIVPRATRKQAGRAQIVRIDEWPAVQSARVVIVLDQAAAYRVSDAPTATGEDARLLIDLDATDVGDGPKEISGAGVGGILSSIHTEPGAKGARVTLELHGTGFRRVFPLRDPFRLVVDVTRNMPGIDTASRAITRVALDPGHGGNDPGAIGPSGVREKEMTLDIAKRAAAALSIEGLSVMLTREEDRFVSLEERTARANGFGADLFVSVHCNASESRARRGIETYVLDTSRDEVANRIAARENASTGGSSSELTTILRNMRLADQSTRSSVLAKLVERATVASMKLRFPDVVNGGVHPAAFYVLVGARMPAVLFEAGYLSNVVEEQRIATPEVRQRLADGIVNAVKAYRQGR